MKIGIDCCELGGRPTGVGRFLRAILAGIAASPSPHEFYLYHHGDGALPEGPQFVARSIGGRGKRIVREQLRLPRLSQEDRLDFFYSPGYWLPLRLRAPAAFTLHDVSFMSHPEWYSMRDRVKRAWLSKLSVRRARAIVTDSEFSAGEIVRHFGVPRERVFLATVGLDPELLAEPAAGGPHIDLPGELILTVGSIFQRRRTDILLQAFRTLLEHRPNLTLWIAGENRTYPRVDYERTARELGFARRVVFSGYTDESVVRALYRRAAVLVYLSEYEGFGLPPLEACAFGVPVITSRGSSLEEVFSGAALLVDPASPEQVAAATLRAISDPEVRATLIENGRRLAQQHTPAAAAASFLDLAARVMAL